MVGNDPTDKTGKRQSPLPRNSGFWSRFIANIAGSLSEAWTELRTHKLRVILSLIGIAVAVAALTAVVALGELQKQAVMEGQERWGGRIATLRVDAWNETGAPIDWAAMEDRFERVNERYGFTHTTRLIEQSVMAMVQLPTGVEQVVTTAFDPAYPTIHRTKLLTGRWFTESDSELLAPPIIVSESLWERLGSPPLELHPTLELSSEFSGLYQVVGVVPKDGEWDTELRLNMLFDTYLDRVEAVPEGVPVSREIWVDGKKASEIGPVFAMDMRAGLPSDVQLSVTRSDSGASPGFEESFLMMQLITSAISSIVLLLGGLSLVNIQLVAMRQRIREIGVRRSFGASAGRIFTSVMMESVVATTVAGVLGVALAVAIIRSPLVMQNLFYGLQDVPPFPFSAALVGLIAAVVTGAIAGLVPAIVATKVRVIDAIRF